MHARQLEALMVALSGWSGSDLEVRTGTLRANKMLPKGGRGLHAPEISPADAAIVLIGMASAHRAVEAAEKAQVYGGLRPSGQNAAFLGASTLLEALTIIIGDFGISGRIERIRVCRSRPFVRIEYLSEDGKGELRYQDYLDLDEVESRPCFIQVEVVIEGPAIHELTAELAEVESGWSGE